MKKKRKQIPPEVYDKEYLLSSYLEGYEEFKKGSLSFLKSNEINMLRLREGMTLLEVGVGRGELLFHCAKKGVKVSGIDYSKDAVEIAKTLFKSVPDADLRVADCRKLPFESHSFERVFSGDVIEHLCFEDGITMLKEMYRVLKPGGFLLIHTSPNSIFTKLTYPMGKPFLKLINKDLIKRIDYTLDVVGSKVHIHEYSLLSLRKAAKKAGLKDAKVWISKDLLRSGKHRYTQDLQKSMLIRFLGSCGKLSLVRFMLGNDLYLKCYKKQGVRQGSYKHKGHAHNIHKYDTYKYNGQ
jgi:ubiquinone/menaquinone biosynthesis C-methylase UbiE